jgi:hypothetical protein
VPPLSVITAPSVLDAIAEHDELALEPFLARRHGFAEARAYVLVHEGRLQGDRRVAHGHATGRPLASGEFSGGNATVAAALRRLGFTVYGSASPPWTRDEVILACDLVVANGGHELRTGDPRVTELSELLQLRLKRQGRHSACRPDQEGTSPRRPSEHERRLDTKTPAASRDKQSRPAAARGPVA